jgi:OTU domain-containing protein 6
MQKAAQAILHKAPKGDKKAKNEANETVKKMEEELKLRHEKELLQFESQQTQEETSDKEDEHTNGIEASLKNLSTNDNVDEPVEKKKPSKQKKRREAKEAKELERQRRIAEERKNMISPRDEEYNLLKQKLLSKNLTIREVCYNI